MGSKCLMETNKTKAEEYQRRRKAIQQKFIDKENEINTMKNDIAALWEAINNMQKKKELE
jgi:putative methionine-R-sulfoxide reductase with GAF domain